MRNISVPKPFYILALFFATFNLCARSAALPQNFYSYKLANGLELYVQEDFSLPTVRMEYVSRAGTVRGQKDTAGFFRLYSRLFWQNSVPGLSSYLEAGALNFSAECVSSQSRYGFSVPVQNFETVFALFASSLKYPFFSDEAIQNELQILKNEAASWASSAGGFINSTVDALVFSQAPWKKDSGLYPALFAKTSTEELRQKLSRISKSWYVPNQSALFVSGPAEAQKVLAAVKKELGDWECGFYIPEGTDVPQRPAEEHKPDSRFVLISNGFSQDFNQALIQFTASGIGADNVFSAAAWVAAEILQTKWGLYNSQEKDVSFSADGADSRISVQALFAAGIHAKENPLSDTENLLKEVVRTVRNITENDLANAKQKAVLLRSQAFKGPESFIHALSAHWAYGGIEYFFEWPQTVQNLSLQQVTAVFDSPYLFLFVHPNRYKIYERQFIKTGWKTVKQGQNPYIQNTSAAKKQAKQTDGDADSSKTCAEETKAQTDPLNEYTSYTKSRFERFTLSSGIGVHVQQLANTEWTACILNIAGGELKYGFSTKGLESIALLNLASVVGAKLDEEGVQVNIRLPDIKTETELFSGRLFFTCASEHLGNVLRILSSAMQNLDLVPAQADELYFTEAYKRRAANASEERQLQDAAMETFFGNTEAAPFFGRSEQLLPTVTYEQIRFACRSLYAPENFDIILCGGIPRNIEEISEHYFGEAALTSPDPDYAQKPAYTKESLIPAFSAGERTVRLRRVFLTDVPASEAGERPAKLIPTTDFSDPARMYLKAPAFGTKEEIIFSALMYEIADRLTQEFQNEKNAPATAVSAQTDSEPFSLSFFHFIKVKSKSRLQKAFTDCIRSLAEELQPAQKQDTGADTDTALRKKIISRYTGIFSRSLISLESRANLMRQGLEYADNPALYTERLLILTEADEKDFSNVFADYIQKVPVFWFFSADTKKM